MSLSYTSYLAHTHAHAHPSGRGHTWLIQSHIVHTVVGLRHPNTTHTPTPIYNWGKLGNNKNGYWKELKTCTGRRIQACSHEMRAGWNNRLLNAVSVTTNSWSFPVSWKNTFLNETHWSWAEHHWSPSVTTNAATWIKHYIISNNLIKPLSYDGVYPLLYTVKAGDSAHRKPVRLSCAVPCLRGFVKKEFPFEAVFQKSFKSTHMVVLWNSKIVFHGFNVPFILHDTMRCVKTSSQNRFGVVRDGWVFVRM